MQPLVRWDSCKHNYYFISQVIRQSLILKSSKLWNSSSQGGTCTELWLLVLVKASSESVFKLWMLFSPQCVTVLLRSSGFLRFLYLCCWWWCFAHLFWKSSHMPKLPLGQQESHMFWSHLFYPLLVLNSFFAPLLLVFLKGLPSNHEFQYQYCGIDQTLYVMNCII